MVLALSLDPEKQAQLEALAAAQQNPVSPLYRRWITPEEYGRRFGASDRDIRQIETWLTAHGFRIDEIPQGRRSIVFSGTAGQVSSTFGSEIHRYSIGGRIHHASGNDQQIPEALAPVVSGIVSLHDFQSQPTLSSIHRLDSPDFSVGGGHYLAPADFATIYDLNPLYAGSIDGTGASVAVVARSNFLLSDAQGFRTRMGLPSSSPTVILNGPDPGVLDPNEQTEVTLDTEWAGAVARQAAVKVVVSASTYASDGVTLSAQYIVNNNVAPAMTVSFSLCEAAAGAPAAQFWNSLWQQAAVEGITVFAASGDSGAAGCDPPSALRATAGPSVNVICSSPYSVCVGGTQFNDSSTPALYWSATSGAGLGSALSYIPEAAWNTSGAVSGGAELWATGGGTSIFYSKPVWQAGNGVPADAFRHVPDVALTAAPHDAYLIYLNGGLYSVAGTSASAPAWAGIMALVNQQVGQSQGNANPFLYGLFGLQMGGGAPVFHDVTGGSNSVPGASGYAAGAGYDQATGLGSPDVFLLVQHWRDVIAPGGGNASSSPAPGGATHFSVIPPAAATAGKPIQVEVAALDSNNEIVSGYTDPVRLTSTDAFAVLPPDSHLTNGVGFFTVVLGTAGASVLTASDSLNSSINGASAGVTVSAAAGLHFVPVTPCRVADTRKTSGPFGGPSLTAGSSRSFLVSSSSCGIPATAQAYSLNIAAAPTSNGYLTIWPLGQSQPMVATLIFSNRVVKSTAAIVQAGTNGALSVFASGNTDVVMDINGYFVPNTNPAGLAFYPVTPCRLVDTRNGSLLYGPFVSGASRTIPVLSSGCNIPSTARAYSLNFAAVPPAAVGYLTAYPTGAARPLVATLNDIPGTVMANAAIVPAGTGGSVDVYATNETDLVVDINGYFAPAGTGGLSLYTVPPCRVLDTRQNSRSFTGQLNIDVFASACGGTMSVRAYVLNATVVPSGPLGYLTLWAEGTPRPPVATLNSLTGDIADNMAIVATNNTGTSAYATNNTDLILDMFGYFAP
jgi:hypothetical protein